MGRWVSDKEYWEDDLPASETIDGWLDEQIRCAENAVGEHRSYGDKTSFRYGTASGRLLALKEVRRKLNEFWGIGDGQSQGETK